MVMRHIGLEGKLTIWGNADRSEIVIVAFAVSELRPEI